MTGAHKIICVRVAMARLYQGLILAGCRDSHVHLYAFYPISMKRILMLSLISVAPMYALAQTVARTHDTYFEALGRDFHNPCSSPQLYCLPFQPVAPAAS